METSLWDIARKPYGWNANYSNVGMPFPRCLGVIMVLVDGTAELESDGHATGPRNDGEVRTFCSQRQILGSTLHKGCDNTT
jgi:hypothetical protein